MLSFMDQMANGRRNVAAVSDSQAGTVAHQSVRQCRNAVLGPADDRTRHAANGSFRAIRFHFCRAALIRSLYQWNEALGLRRNDA